jgi:hypothetical protein
MRPPYTKPRGKMPTPRGPKLTFPDTIEALPLKPHVEEKGSGVARAISRMNERDWLLGSWRHEP